MPFEPTPYSPKSTPPAIDPVGIDALHAKCFGVGGGDPYIAELVRESRNAGYEVKESLTRRVSPDLSTFRPPGFESQD